MVHIICVSSTGLHSNHSVDLPKAKAHFTNIKRLEKSALEIESAGFRCTRKKVELDAHHHCLQYLIYATVDWNSREWQLDLGVEIKGERESRMGVGRDSRKR